MDQKKNKTKLFHNFEFTKAKLLGHKIKDFVDFSKKEK